jgi:adenine-specific DNA-methyltransferase
LLLARELLHDSGSLFVQISDENLHHVRELMDEVFNPTGFVALVTYRTSTPLGAAGIPSACDYLLWYSPNIDRLKFRPLFEPKPIGEGTEYTWILESDGTTRKMSNSERVLPPLELEFAAGWVSVT